jgi:DNA gyrase/topoisomerase IV subunit B
MADEYKQLSIREHALLRSDNYIGSTVTYDKSVWLVSEGKIVQKKISFNDAFERIHLESLSNAIDNVVRSREAGIPQTKIEITIRDNVASFYNDGKAVSCTACPENEDIMLPEFVFGVPLVSSNYDDDKERYTAGRNGIGIKATNIFSTSFLVDIFDPTTGKRYQQKWKDNMSICEPAKITSLSGRGFVKITFTPDFSRFDGYTYTKDFISLMERYAIDASLTSGVPVIFNGKEYPPMTLQEYTKFFTKDGSSEEDSEDTSEDGKENPVERMYLESIRGASSSKVVIIPSPFGKFQAVSFVNGIPVASGVHIDKWAEAVFRPIKDKLSSKKELAKVTITEVKNQFMMFVLCSLDKPTFGSQTKEKLTSPIPPIEVPDSAIKTLLKWEVISNIEDKTNEKAQKVLNKRRRRLPNIRELEDAVLASKRNSHCTLVFCEGLSAKNFVVPGLKYGMLGDKDRNKYGIFALRGKFQNVRNSSEASNSENKIVKSIMDSIGLQLNVDYSVDRNFNSLRYKRVVSITDADCFTDDDVLIIKKDDTVSVVEIDNLFDGKLNMDTQLVNNTQVWSDDGWVNILAVRRKTTTKRILTINTYSGLVRCTEDHKLLLENGEEIKACDVKIGDKLSRNRRTGLIPKVTENMGGEDIRKIMRGLQCFRSGRAQNKKDMINAINNEAKFCTEYVPPILSDGKYFDISEEEAWVWGLFFADGTCGVYTFEKNRKKFTEKSTEKSRKRWENKISYHTVEELTIKLAKAKANGEKYGKINKKLRESKLSLEKSIKNSTRVSMEYRPVLLRTNYNYSITNCNRSMLERAFKILTNRYPEYNWSIIETTVKNVSKDSNDNVGHHVGVHQRAFRLLLNGGKKVNEFIEAMRLRFYTSKKLKKVPDEILNNKVEIQKAFYDGYYDGDGFRALKEKKNAEGFDVLGQVGAQGLCYLVQRLGFCSSIQEGRNPNVFTIHVSKRFRRFYPGEVRSVYETAYENRFVFDVETVTGKINVGVGDMIQRNCDGIHITGLILNFFHHYFPSLVERGDFLYSMRTPILRIVGSGVNNRAFYNQEVARKFITENKVAKKSVRYYKGLGSSSKEEIKDTFGKRMVKYVSVSKQETTSSIELGFSKEEADRRKKWLEDFDETKEVQEKELDDYEVEELTIQDFINNELIYYAIDDCKRSIPNVFDGFKEAQRKVLYGAFLKGLKPNGEPFKVCQLAGYIGEKTSYHHGEDNLNDTIINMARSFVGTNNIPILSEDGQFGSRKSREASAPRYIKTKQRPLTRLIFREEDDRVLEYVVDDGDVIEPKFYVPIIPMILVNGCAGIGVGWSSSIPCYSPLKIVEMVKEWISTGNINTEGLIPWYRGFSGKIEKDTEKDDRFVCWGKVSKTQDSKTYTITELPVSTCYEESDPKKADYKKFLDKLREEEKIMEYKYVGDEENIKIVMEMGNDFNPNKTELKLKSYIHTSNMVLFAKNGGIKKYTIADIFEEFCEVRLEFYEKRRNALLKEYSSELKLLKNKKRFISEVLFVELTEEEKVENEIPLKVLSIRKVSDTELEEVLEERKYDKDSEGGYNYLLNISVRGMTRNKIDVLKLKIEGLASSIESLTDKTSKQIWLEELDEFLDEYKKIYGNGG